MPSLPPLINGIAYAYTDISVNIQGVVLAGISAVTYNQTEAKANNYGAGRYATSRGAGKIEPEASITIDRAELNALINGAPNKSLLNIQPFDIIVAYAPLGSAPVVDVIKNVQFTSEGSGGAVDDTSIDTELALLPSHIEFNGI